MADTWWSVSTKSSTCTLGLVPVRENLWALGPATVKLNLKTRWFTVLHHQHVQACDPTTWPLQKVDMWMQKVVGRDGKGMVKSAPKHATTVAAQAEDQGGCTLTIVQAALGSAYQLQALRRSCCCLH